MLIAAKSFAINVRNIAFALFSTFVAWVVFAYLNIIFGTKIFVATFQTFVASSENYYCNCESKDCFFHCFDFIINTKYKTCAGNLQ